MNDWINLYVMLVFTHFVMDWVFQSDWEARNKTKHHGIRALHCTTYALGFLPALVWILEIPEWKIGISLGYLFVTHFIIDTYIPTYLWAKHISRNPDVVEGGIKAFRAQFQTPRGFVVYVTVDQIFHLSALWGLIWFLLA